MSLFPYLHGLGEDMCGRSGRRSRDRSERRFERMYSCFPHAREAHRRLCVSRRRVLPDIAWWDPARESFPTAVRETWWHQMPYLRNGYEGEPALEQLPTAGLSANYVAAETKRAIAAVKNSVPIYPGIDIDISTAKNEKQ